VYHPSVLYTVARYSAPQPYPPAGAEDSKSALVPAETFFFVNEFVDLTPLAPGGEQVAEVWAESSGKFWSHAIVGAAPKAGIASIAWRQDFVKRSADASVAFNVTQAQMRLFDPLGDDPWEMVAKLHIRAFRDPGAGVPGPISFLQEFDAEIRGNRSLTDTAWTSTISMPGAFNLEYEHFDNEGTIHTTGMNVTFSPFTTVIPLADLAVGQPFGVVYELTAFALGEGSDSSGQALFHDPVDPDTGVQVVASGVEIVPEPGTAAVLVGAAAFGLGRRRRGTFRAARASMAL